MDHPLPDDPVSAEAAPPRRRGAGTATAEEPYRRLRSRVDAAFAARGLSRKGGGAMAFKVVLVLLQWGFWYGVTLSLGTAHFALALAASLPLAASLVNILLGVMHDGSHGAGSEHRFVNRLLQSTLVAAGVSAVSWHYEHVVQHHANTNVLGHDSDLETGGLLLRFHAGQPWRPIHRYQHWYAWPLYGLISFKWTWFEDFDDVLANRYGLPPRQRLVHLVEVLAAKVSQVSLFFVVPALAWGWPKAAAFYVVQLYVVGVLMATVFVLAHVSGVQAMPESPQEAPRDWAIFQVATTANYATGNRLLTWLIGGLNYQVEHHLFPSVSYRHYPWIRQIVRRWADEQGVPYHEFPTMAAALRAHFRHLASLGRAS
ncbi:MAG TPA: acyl-CoA desaturase [Vicinamibacteria bacterium]|jgi:linoleoyl-CoA desaturase